MAIDYPALADVADELIRDNGRSVRLERAGPPDAATPWEAGANVGIDTVGVQVEFSYAERVGGVVDSQDFRFLVTAADIDGSTFETIKSGDILISGANLYSVIEAQEVRPASVVVYYDLRVRA